MEENQKISKIIEEFTFFLLEEEKEIFHISVKKLKRKVSLTFECEKLSSKTMAFLKSQLKTKRQEEIEMYGWELLGYGGESEMSLMSTLIDYMTYYETEKSIHFNLVRYEEL